MEELEALKEVQHNLCDMAEMYYRLIDNDEAQNSGLSMIDLSMACTRVEWAYRLGKIIDKLEEAGFEPG